MHHSLSSSSSSSNSMQYLLSPPCKFQSDPPARCSQNSLPVACRPKIMQTYGFECVSAEVDAQVACRVWPSRWTHERQACKAPKMAPCLDIAETHQAVKSGKHVAQHHEDFRGGHCGPAHIDKAQAIAVPRHVFDVQFGASQGKDASIDQLDNQHQGVQGRQSALRQGQATRNVQRGPDLLSNWAGNIAGYVRKQGPVQYSFHHQQHHCQLEQKMQGCKMN